MKQGKGLEMGVYDDTFSHALYAVYDSVSEEVLGQPMVFRNDGHFRRSMLDAQRSENSPIKSPDMHFYRLGSFDLSTMALEPHERPRRLFLEDFDGMEVSSERS